MHAVLTTVNLPSDSVAELNRRISETGCRLIVVGDTKGPASYDLPGVHFLPYGRQSELGFRLYDGLPTRHYARKNLGYLYAMSQGAPAIYETDDDNAPLPSWRPRSQEVSGVRSVSQAAVPRWVNVYRYFTREAIWPRGLPLDAVTAELPPVGAPGRSVSAPIQQGLVNGSPDVDAVWRLTQDRPFAFDDEPSVVLEPGNWCPFNTQSTWWWPEAYPLMYVPSFCSFRMCDIWKSFVAQRCLWALGRGIVFHAPEVVQDRNVHNLMKDFEDEVPGYLGNRRFADILNGLNLASGRDAVAGNVLACYEALVRAEFFPEKELVLVRAWVQDVERLVGGGAESGPPNV